MTAKYVGNGRISLKWDKVEGADSYTVYVKQDGKFKKVDTVEKNSFKFNNAKKKGTYEFMVKYTIDDQTSKPSKSYQAECKVKKSVSKKSK